MTPQDCQLCKMIESLARQLMASKGMPSLVINAPEDDDDEWRVYPSGCPAIGSGRSLKDAVKNAFTHPQVRAMGEPA